jgi:adenosylcobinamide-GDP ribazoletransferase
MEAMRYPPWSEGNRRLGELWMAARFFTRLRLGPDPVGDGVPLAHAAWAFPVVGVAVGLVCGIVALIARAAHVPALAAALVAVAAGVLVTGGLHEDGLADTADGLGGGHDRAQKLAIMRDERCGAFAVLALVFSVGLRAVAVSMLTGGEAVAAFIAAHAVGRGGLAAALFLMQPARTDGLGYEAGRPEIAEAVASLLIAAAVALLALRIVGGFAALIAAVLAMAAIAKLADRAIGGYTGDVLGAIEQGGETVVLLAAASWAW